VAVQLTASGAEVKVRRAARPAEQQARRTKASILVVDDDANKLVALRSVLDPLGENIVEARSGTDALRHVLHDDFAVILLDVRMPIMNGFETAEMIRQRPSSELTPIIFVTALDQAETDMGRGYELRAVDFVFAPVVPSILRAKVSVFVELYKAQHELKRYRDQLQGLVQERTAALKAINRELEAFNTVVSNDLKSPLAALDTGTRQLLASSGELDDATRVQVERVRQSSRHLSELLEGVQTLFKITRGDIRRERVNVSRIASEIVEDLHAKEPERSVEASISPDLAVDGDARLVRLLLANLIDNAWKFTRNELHPQISVGSEVDSGEIRIFVRDNGVGFDMIYAHRLFGAFQRLHSQSEFPGDGIGLAAAQRIVNRHGGRIWAEGAVGEGASFYFVL
jgi:signal transduction histidine kinase